MSPSIVQRVPVAQPRGDVARTSPSNLLVSWPGQPEPIGPVARLEFGPGDYSCVVAHPQPTRLRRPFRIPSALLRNIRARESFSTFVTFGRAACGRPTRQEEGLRR